MALPVPEEAGALLQARLEPLRDRHASPRWIPARHLHLTLVFIGAVAPQDVPRIRASMGAVAARHDVIEITLGTGSGIARRDEGGVAWLTVSVGGASIVRLAEDLRQELLARSASRRTLDDRPESWRPHMTVARRASTALITELQDLPVPVDPVSWRADSVVLFRSHQGPPGARYEPVAVSPLRAGNA
ncbi:MAG: RNA 2',3'-cyclic phosphodiesterase [Chloroflexota bacterium]|nr:RNA 2',3'-cyclic phosphodiesterase [Chloroflexota bacterium]